MSFLSWLSGRGKAAPARIEDEVSSGGFARADATTPLMPRPAAHAAAVVKPQAATVNEPGDTGATRRGERSARRELLYNVVRQSMMRAGILSASYKFKVLSLDARGRQFLIMVDLAREVGGDTTRLAEIEALIAQAAKTRHDIAVSSVYWRMNEHVALGVPLVPRSVSRAVEAADPTVRVTRPPLARPAVNGIASPPLDAKVEAPSVGLDVPETAPPAQAPAKLAAQATLAAASPVKSRFEPIQDDEVAAFRRALQAGLTQPVPLRATPSVAAVAAAGAAGAAGAIATSTIVAPRAPKPAVADPLVEIEEGERRGERNYTLLTGFEDTEMPPGGEMPALSETQYGGLN